MTEDKSELRREKRAAEGGEQGRHGVFGAKTSGAILSSRCVATGLTYTSTVLGALRLRKLTPLSSQPLDPDALARSGLGVTKSAVRSHSPPGEVSLDVKAPWVVALALGGERGGEAGGIEIVFCSKLREGATI